MAQWIQPSGPRDAKIVVCGRDCGWHEMQEQRGFVGPAGKLIWHPSRHGGAADRAGLPRVECLVTNVVNTQPLRNDWSKHNESDIARGMDELRDLLSAAPRVLVVALGEQAGLACAGIVPALDSKTVSTQFADRFGDSITNVRGYVYTGSAACPILVALHPAFILRNWHPWWATFCWDWQKAARIAAAGSYQEPRFSWETAPCATRTHEIWLQAKTLAVDIETSGTGCVAFSSDGEHAIVFPGKPQQGHPHEAEIQALLECPAAKVFQNGQFDVTMMERVGWRVNNWQYDTMLMWHALEPLLAGSQKDDSAKGRKKAGGKRTEKGLRFLASLLTNSPFYKDYSFTDDTDQFELCARDACVTWKCWRTLRERLVAA